MPVGDEIARLRFMAQHAERIYLNPERTDDRFTLLLGSVEAWTAKAAKEGGVTVGPGFLTIGGKGTTGDEVRYDLTNPLARAMLLRTVLEDRGEVRDPKDAKELEYVAVT